MAMGFEFEEDSMWDTFIGKHGINSETESDFLKYLFDEDIDPDESSLKILEEAWEEYNMKGNL